MEDVGSDRRDPFAADQRWAPKHQSKAAATSDKSLEHQAAILIQRISRGKLARNRTKLRVMMHNDNMVI
jgi:hypothetical protein